MKKQICQYSIIRFQPYTETEEFANIGIVLYVPEFKRFEFKLLDIKNNGRVTHFFGAPCKEIFIQATKIIKQELVRIKKISVDMLLSEVNFYAELIRDREDIIRFSDSRVVYCDDPMQILNQLFEHYIHHKFTKNEGYEDQLKQKVKDLLIERQLNDLFKTGSIGDAAIYEVNFPFINKEIEKTVIKPIHFRHDKPSQIINHGIDWLAKVQQLKKYNYIQPDRVLFAYSAPEKSSKQLFDAFYDIKVQIENEGIVMADINQGDDVVRFASPKH
ncbi:MAG: DUF3037 domain-containing protein [Methylococcaceae bacterium]